MADIIPSARRPYYSGRQSLANASSYAAIQPYAFHIQAGDAQDNYPPCRLFMIKLTVNHTEPYRAVHIFTSTHEARARKAHVMHDLNDLV